MVLLDTDTWQRGDGMPRVRNPDKAKSLIEAIKRREVAERDLAVIHAPGGGVAGTLDGVTLDAPRVAAIRERYGAGDSRLQTLLIGKDGGVKLRVDGVPELDRVFALIDGMPMRRAEMRERGRPCAG